MGETRVVRNEELAAGDVLVGAAGGRARVVGGSVAVVFGALVVETEHGTLYLDPDGESTVERGVAIADCEPLTTPLDLAACRELIDRDGWVHRVVSVTLDESTENALEEVLDLLSTRLVGSEVLLDTQFEAVGVRDGAVLVKVTGKLDGDGGFDCDDACAVHGPSCDGCDHVFFHTNACLSSSVAGPALDLDALAAELVELYGEDELAEVLDDLCHEVASEMAAAANNSGAAGQLGWLQEMVGEKRLAAVVAEFREIAARQAGAETS
ncbi:MAG: hypothetical protein ACYCXY_12535 [Acidimicrobiales bacterium]